MNPLTPQEKAEILFLSPKTPGDTKDAIEDHQELPELLGVTGVISVTGSSRESPAVTRMSPDVTRNIAHEIRLWIEEEPGRFHVSELDKALHIHSRLAQARKQAVYRLLKDGIIERTGVTRGYYQAVDKDCQRINFLEQDNREYPLLLPFKLHEHVRIMPGNIIVVAGEPNAGKTAFLLNTILLNTRSNILRSRSKTLRSCERTCEDQDQGQEHTGDVGDIHYFTSECASELRSRLELFDTPLESWNFSAYERSHSFHQVIHPNDLNIIDYLEVHDDFYKVGGLLAQIHDKLENGVALVAIQKNKGTDFGIGGGRGLEKPRLYLSLSANPPEGNTIKIVKAKNYRGENPNGKELDFKLIAGWKLHAMTDWRHVSTKAGR
jgi:hypothetical protein